VTASPIPLWKRIRVAELVAQNPDIKISELQAELNLAFTSAQRYRAHALDDPTWPIEAPAPKKKASEVVGYPMPPCAACHHRRVHHFVMHRERFPDGRPRVIRQNGEYEELPVRCGVDTDNRERKKCGCKQYVPALNAVGA
jgi:hypothetical protein